MKVLTINITQVADSYYSGSIEGKGWQLIASGSTSEEVKEELIQQLFLQSGIWSKDAYHKGRKKALEEIREYTDKWFQVALQFKKKSTHECALANARGLVSAYYRVLQVIKGKIAKNESKN